VGPNFVLDKGFRATGAVAYAFGEVVVLTTDGARVLAGGAIAVNDRVANDATCRVVTKAQAAAGAQPTPVVGTAMTAATQAGDFVDVLLTPGDTY
jgi:hypothetical protein